jgi:hypothetical protein
MGSRTATLIIRAMLAGKVRQIERVTGSIGYLVDRVSSHAPQVAKQDIRQALMTAAWADKEL